MHAVSNASLFWQSFDELYGDWRTDSPKALKLGIDFRNWGRYATSSTIAESPTRPGTP